ncbi:MAG: hypothetical protein EXQ54_03645 [Acidobacteria bacterium]|nr:hypothetical protein [Acidobacteriota bacterium]
MARPVAPALPRPLFVLLLSASSADAPKPAAVEDYRLPVIATNVLGILDALGMKQVRIVGHDWGAGH